MAHSKRMMADTGQGRGRLGGWRRHRDGNVQNRMRELEGGDDLLMDITRRVVGRHTRALRGGRLGDPAGVSDLS